MIYSIYDKLFSNNIQSVLEAGCGSKPASLHIQCPIHMGIDVDEYGLECASKVMPVCRCNMVYMDSVFHPKQFDLVLFSDSLEHLSYDDAVRAFEAAKTIGKMVFIFIPENSPSGPNDVGPHRQLHLWTEEQFVKFMQRPVLVLEDYHGKGKNAMISIWAEEEIFNTAFEALVKDQI